MYYYFRLGEEIPDSETKESDTKEAETTSATTSYRLRGIVVHSGQASGGHYYSFIRVRYVVFLHPSWPASSGVLDHMRVIYIYSPLQKFRTTPTKSCFMLIE